MAITRIISKLQPELTQIGEYKVAHISDNDSLNKIRKLNPDALIVLHEDLIPTVLQDDDFYLHPTFSMHPTRHQCDGFFDQNKPEEILHKIEVLSKSILKYKDPNFPENNDSKIIVKILRYLFSRGIQLDAVNSRFSKIGYSYQLIEDISIESNPIQILKKLNEYAEQDIFKAEIIDKINICFDCESSYLNFSECCTQCNSLDLKTENLVHHFRCAYIGPESDFNKDNSLVCPKCDKILKHIGIDYDKPSEIHKCGNCNHQSQETKMKAKCVDCRRENELDQLLTYHIFNFIPTEKAKSWALKNENATRFNPTEVGENSDLSSATVYNLIKSHESKKPKQEKYSSYEMVCTIHDEILKGLNSNLQIKLKTELASIIKNYLQEQDLICLDPVQGITALLISYDPESKSNLQDVLEYNLNKMVKDNQLTQENHIEISIQNLNS